MSKSQESGSSNMVDSEARITIARPVADVFAFWRGLENFPRFMNHVKEVRTLGKNHHLWRVTGPLAAEFSWESDVTRVVDNQAIAWRSRPGSSIANAGEVQFTASPQGGTEIHVRLSYAPPAGVVGHAVATVLGANPGQQMQEDLERCKKLLESGAVASGSGAVSEGQVRRPVSDTGRVG